MNDILHYIKMDPYFRQFNHHDITFSLMYAFSENFVLPLSHDEVVHMKGSLINKMPGTDEEKFAGVRAFYTYMLTHPGKKLLMMGSEFGQWNEWHYEHSLDWHLLELEGEDGDRHRALKAFFQAVNAFYLAHPELWELDFSWEGFEWIEADDNQANTIAFLRKDKKGSTLVTVCNFSPVDRTGYTIGVPTAGTYTCLFSTDDPAFGGLGRGDGQEPVYRVSRPGAGHHSVPAPHERRHLQVHPQVPVPPEKNRRSRAQGCKVRQGSQGGPQKDHPQVQGILTLFPVKR